MANLHEDGQGGKGLTVHAFAERSGLSVATVQKYCREGKIFGARLHTSTRQWWIYPPAKLLCGPKAKRGNTSSLMRSTSHGAKQG